MDRENRVFQGDHGDQDDQGNQGCQAYQCHHENHKSQENQRRCFTSLSSKLALTVALLLGMATTSMVEAKDLSSRLGVGYRNALPFSVPSVAMAYYPTATLGIVGSLGIDTLQDNSKFAFQGGIRKVIFKEEHLNFYAGGSLSILTQEVAAVKTSGYELAGTVGCEFFFAGLENLGVSFEMGVAVASMDRVRFRTVGDDFTRAGMIFYF